MAQIDFKKCTLVISDGTAVTPLTTTVSFGEGNFTWTRNTPRKYIMDRGLVASGTVRNDDEQPLELSFAAVMLFLISDGTEATTVYEALHREGDAAAWVSTSADTCEPYACDLTFTFDPDCGSTKTEVQLFPDFRVEQCSPDAKAGTVSFTGKCKVTAPTITRVT